jgi:hypothetical protein
MNKYEMRDDRQVAKETFLFILFFLKEFLNLLNGRSSSVLHILWTKMWITGIDIIHGQQRIMQNARPAHRTHVG